MQPHLAGVSSDDSFEVIESSDLPAACSNLSARLSGANNSPPSFGSKSKQISHVASFIVAVISCRERIIATTKGVFPLDHQQEEDLHVRVNERKFQI